MERYIIEIEYREKQYKVPVEIIQEGLQAEITAIIEGQSVKYRPDENDQLQAIAIGSIDPRLAEEVGRTILKGL